MRVSIKTMPLCPTRPKKISQPISYGAGLNMSHYLDSATQFHTLSHNSTLYHTYQHLSRLRPRRMITMRRWGDLFHTILHILTL